MMTNGASNGTHHAAAATAAQKVVIVSGSTEILELLDETRSQIGVRYPGDDDDLSG